MEKTREVTSNVKERVGPSVKEGCGGEENEAAAPSPARPSSSPGSDIHLRSWELTGTLDGGPSPDPRHEGASPSSPLRIGALDGCGDGMEHGNDGMERGGDLDSLEVLPGTGAGPIPDEEEGPGGDDSPGGWGVPPRGR